jgi:hypothetical protein
MFEFIKNQIVMRVLMIMFGMAIIVRAIINPNNAMQRVIDTGFDLATAEETEKWLADRAAKDEKRKAEKAERKSRKAEKRAASMVPNEEPTI